MDHDYPVLAITDNGDYTPVTRSPPPARYTGARSVSASGVQSRWSNSST